MFPRNSITRKYRPVLRVPREQAASLRRPVDSRGTGRRAAHSACVIPVGGLVGVVPCGTGHEIVIITS